MPDESAVDMGLVSRQLRQVLEEMGTMRNDRGVMVAILQRLDGTVAGLVNKIRATHSQQSRMDRRVRELEGRP